MGAFSGAKVFFFISACLFGLCVGQEDISRKAKKWQDSTDDFGNSLEEGKIYLSRDLAQTEEKSSLSKNCKKFTFSKSHFHKIHNSKVSFFTKFTFLKRQILGNF